MGKKSDVATDVLGNAITVLEALKDASDAISAVPCLGAVFAAALGLLQTIERMNTSNERCKRLALRAQELAEYIEKRIAQNVDGVDEDLTANLNKLCALLRSIQTDVESLNRRKLFVKLLQSSSIAGKLDDHIAALDSAWRSFDACCLLSIDRKLNEQKNLALSQRLYDDEYRVFRYPDLIPFEACDDFLPEDGYPHGAMLAHWGNQVVVKRILRAHNAERPDVKAICKRYPPVTHPRIAKVLGYSDSILEEPYYVIYTEGRPVQDYLSDITDTKAILRFWLQSLLDFKSAYTYLTKEEDRAIVSGGSSGHIISLSTTRVDATNRLLFSADDARDRFYQLLMFWQYHYSYYLQHSKMSHFFSFQPVDATLLQTCLSALQNNTRAPDFDHLELYHFTWDLPHESSVSVRLGDFGYMTKDRQFIHLGNIVDIISALNGGPLSDSEIWEDFTSSHSCLRKQDVKDRFSGIRYTPDTDSQWGHANCRKMVRLVDRWLQLFWNHVVHFAAQKDIALHDIVIAYWFLQNNEVKWYRRRCAGCRERVPQCQTCHGGESSSGIYRTEYVRDSSGDEFEFEVSDMVQSNLSDSAPFSLDLYFHLTHASNGVYKRGSLMPWGYWSLDPEPCPGPWPDIVSDNFHVVQRRTRSSVHWQFLPPLEAAMLTYMKGYKLPHLPFYAHTTRSTPEITWDWHKLMSVMSATKRTRVERSCMLT
ncbi:hypothetical protein CERSUDRAFT_118277 [Gelatoporia subvermispora B]|uniref:Mixed lineage kinase domain-containing protein n=1 Tax=Ceriporiopsis subvermispora (strain B) TaxID=914234 RepID=M2Q8Q3_CERS8|nr:hypothetical protein CERSUDRAFT_118277 [Gelatoporia subvermispora B]